jgi:Zn-dependent protease with chaperone function
MVPVPAVYFDGRKARPHVVTITVDSGLLVFAGGDIDRRVPPAELDVFDALASTPRLIRFSDGASCEVADHLAFQDLVAPLGLTSSAVSRWELDWRRAIGAALGLVLLLFLFFRFGLPFGSEAAAEAVPQAAAEMISRHVLEILDRSVLQHTGLTRERQIEIIDAFERLQLTEEQYHRFRVIFRRSDALGANALALPSGTIVVTDELVRLARDDRELLGVLAHEVGHVEERHGLRLLFQTSGVAVLLAWYVGDIGSLAVAAPAALLQAKYSRDFESAADTFAAERLRANGISPSHVADILERLESSRRSGGSFEYLESHPATAERIAWLRKQ